MHYVMKILIKIISLLLIAAMIAQDIVWACPDATGRNAGDTLAVPTMFQPMSLTGLERELESEVAYIAGSLDWQADKIIRFGYRIKPHVDGVEFAMDFTDPVCIGPDGRKIEAKQDASNAVSVTIPCSITRTAAPKRGNYLYKAEIILGREKTVRLNKVRPAGTAIVKAVMPPPGAGRKEEPRELHRISHIPTGIKLPMRDESDRSFESAYKDDIDSLKPEPAAPHADLVWAVVAGNDRALKVWSNRAMSGSNKEYEYFYAGMDGCVVLTVYAKNRSAGTMLHLSPLTDIPAAVELAVGNFMARYQGPGENLEARMIGGSDDDIGRRMIAETMRELEAMGVPVVERDILHDEKKWIAFNLSNGKVMNIPDAPSVSMSPLMAEALIDIGHVSGDLFEGRVADRSVEQETYVVERRTDETVPVVCRMRDLPDGRIRLVLAAGGEEIGYLVYKPDERKGQPTFVVEDVVVPSEYGPEGRFKYVRLRLLQMLSFLGLDLATKGSITIRSLEQDTYGQGLYRMLAHFGLEELKKDRGEIEWHLSRDRAYQFIGEIEASIEARDFNGRTGSIQNAFLFVLGVFATGVVTYFLTESAFITAAVTGGVFIVLLFLESNAMDLILEAFAKREERKKEKQKTLEREAKRQTKSARDAKVKELKARLETVRARVNKFDTITALQEALQAACKGFPEDIVTLPEVERGLQNLLRDGKTAIERKQKKAPAKKIRNKTKPIPKQPVRIQETPAPKPEPVPSEPPAKEETIVPPAEVAAEPVEETPVPKPEPIVAPAEPVQPGEPVREEPVVTQAPVSQEPSSPESVPQAAEETTQPYRSARPGFDTWRAGEEPRYFEATKNLTDIDPSLRQPTFGRYGVAQDDVVGAQPVVSEIPVEPAIPETPIQEGPVIVEVTAPQVETVQEEPARGEPEPQVPALPTEEAEQPVVPELPAAETEKAVTVEEPGPTVEAVQPEPEPAVAEPAQPVKKTKSLREVTEAAIAEIYRGLPDASLTDCDLYLGLLAIEEEMWREKIKRKMPKNLVKKITDLKGAIEQKRAGLLDGPTTAGPIDEKALDDALMTFKEHERALFRMIFDQVRMGDLPKARQMWGRAAEEIAGRQKYLNEFQMASLKIIIELLKATGVIVIPKRPDRSKKQLPGSPIACLEAVINYCTGKVSSEYALTFSAQDLIGKGLRRRKGRLTDLSLYTVTLELGYLRRLGIIERAGVTADGSEMFRMTKPLQDFGMLSMREFFDKLSELDELNHYRMRPRDIRILKGRIKTIAARVRRGMVVSDNPLIHISNSHEDCYYWLKNLTRGKKSPAKGMTLVLFDFHSDTYSENPFSEGTWVYYALQKGYISRLVWVIPPWVKDLKDSRSVENQMGYLDDLKTKKGWDLSYCYPEDIPAIDGNVLVSIDYDFISANEYDSPGDDEVTWDIHKASPGEIHTAADLIVACLKNKSIRPVAFDLCRSGHPYTYDDQVSSIEKCLTSKIREAFSREEKPRLNAHENSLTIRKFDFKKSLFHVDTGKPWKRPNIIRLWREAVKKTLEPDLRSDVADQLLLYPRGGVLYEKWEEGDLDFTFYLNDWVYDFYARRGTAIPYARIVNVFITLAEESGLSVVERGYDENDPPKPSIMNDVFKQFPIHIRNNLGNEIELDIHDGPLSFIDPKTLLDTDAVGFVYDPDGNYYGSPDVIDILNRYVRAIDIEELVQIKLKDFKLTIENLKTYIERIRKAYTTLSRIDFGEYLLRGYRRPFVRAITAWRLAGRDDRILETIGILDAIDQKVHSGGYGDSYQLYEVVDRYYQKILDTFSPKTHELFLINVEKEVRRRIVRHIDTPRVRKSPGPLVMALITGGLVAGPLAGGARAAGPSLIAQFDAGGMGLPLIIGGLAGVLVFIAVSVYAIVRIYKLIKETINDIRVRRKYRQKETIDNAVREDVANIVEQDTLLHHDIGDERLVTGSVYDGIVYPGREWQSRENILFDKNIDPLFGRLRRHAARALGDEGAWEEASESLKAAILGQEEYEKIDNDTGTILTAIRVLMHYMRRHIAVSGHPVDDLLAKLPAGEVIRIGDIVSGRATGSKKWAGACRHINPLLSFLIGDMLELKSRSTGPGHLEGLCAALRHKDVEAVLRRGTDDEDERHIWLKVTIRDRETGEQDVWRVDGMAKRAYSIVPYERGSIYSTTFLRSTAGDDERTV
ncbi:MAG: hypothetical protein PHS37_05035, partial [Candidatus Omnitrophica bacterium]|nr:hypothetical protein [Candidatus Omnitrophota bacterium]